MRRREFLAAVAAAAVAPDAVARRLGGTPLALVTADLESHVVAIELSTGKRHREIATLPGPRSIQTVGNVAVVGHTEEGAVSLIDGPSLRVRVVGGLDEPRYSAGLGGSPYALVTDSARGELVVLDVRLARVVARARLGGAPRHLSVDHRRRLAWVALGNTAEQVAVVDLREPSRPRVSLRIAPPFLAHDVGLTAGGRRWVTSGTERAVALYEGRRRLAVFRADGAPQHVAFLGNRAFVTSGEDGFLRIHDARNARLLGTTRIPDGSFNVEAGWGVALIPSLTRGTLTVVDAGGRVMRQVQAARSSHDASVVMSR